MSPPRPLDAGRPRRLWRSAGSWTLAWSAPVTAPTTPRGRCPEQVAGYLAKYATKSANEPDPRQPSIWSGGPDLPRTRRSGRRRPGHAYELLGKWAHMLGFRGHFATKSRRYSVTLGQLRRASRGAKRRSRRPTAPGSPSTFATSRPSCWPTTTTRPPSSSAPGYTRQRLGHTGDEALATRRRRPRPRVRPGRAPAQDRMTNQLEGRGPQVTKHDDEAGGHRRACRDAVPRRGAELHGDSPSTLCTLAGRGHGPRVTGWATRRRVTAVGDVLAWLERRRGVSRAQAAERDVGGPSEVGSPVHVAGRTFDTKREATELAGPGAGRDGRRRRLPRRPAAGAGRAPPWLETREHTVATKTYVSDQALRRLVPTSIQALQIAAVSEREIARVVRPDDQGRARRGLGRAVPGEPVVVLRVVRARERLIAANPVTGTRVPKSSREPVEMRPLTEEELEASTCGGASTTAGWATSCWCSLDRTALGRGARHHGRGRDGGPDAGTAGAALAPEGVATKSTKGRRSRRVPVANRVLPIVRQLQRGQGAG